MKRDYGINENKETSNYFRLFGYLRLFRNPLQAISLRMRFPWTSVRR